MNFKKYLVYLFSFLFVFLVSAGTASAANFYVRPVSSTNYGSSNGTSYANAWNGLKNINFGSGGVQAGDDLYICGEHLPATSGLLLKSIVAAGTASKPVTIRMDCKDQAGNDDKGLVWGFYKFKKNWTAVGGGIYSTSGADVRWSDVFIQYVNKDSHVLLTRVKNKKLAPGTFYYEGTAPTGGKLYLRLPGDGNPNNQVILAQNGGGYILYPDNGSYLRFYKCNFYGISFEFETMSHVTFDSCDLRYGRTSVDDFSKGLISGGRLITMKPGGNDLTVKNSELSWAGNGIYTLTPGENYLVRVENNSIHDMGTNTFPDGDGHGIGIQNCVGCVIAGNRIWNTGAAIEFWAQNFEMKNNLISHNFIQNTRVQPITGGGGIVVSGNTTLGKRTGFKIFGNIILNTGAGKTEDWQGAGISVNSPDFVEIYNNVIKNSSGVGINLSAPSGISSKGSIYNNIIISPGGDYIKVKGTSNNAVGVDNNLYFTPGQTNALERINLIGISEHDRHSIFSDPLFVSAHPVLAEDFRLQGSSLAIDKGKPVSWLTTDFSGNPVPGGSAPDIGAFERSASVCQPFFKQNLELGMGEIREVAESAQVIVLQQFLTNKGIIGAPTPTGFFGKLTQSALERWQLAQRPVINEKQGDGVFFGSLSRSAINSELCSVE